MLTIYKKIQCKELLRKLPIILYWKMIKNKTRRKKLITLNDILVGNATEDIHIEDNIGNTIKIEEEEKLMD